MNFTPEEFKRFELQHGDILLNEGQGKELIGRPAMYHDELPGACFTNTLVRFRCRSGVLPDFAMCVFLHFMKSGDFQRIAKITTNIAHLGAGRFASASDRQ
jgi:type I restriction enzyme, S subunit